MCFVEKKKNQLVCFFVIVALTFICGVTMLIVEGVSLAGDGQRLSVNDATFAKFFKLLVGGSIILAVAGVAICVCACVIRPLCDRHAHLIC